MIRTTAVVIVVFASFTTTFRFALSRLRFIRACWFVQGRSRLALFSAVSFLIVVVVGFSGYVQTILTARIGR